MAGWIRSTGKGFPASVEGVQALPRLTPKLAAIRDRWCWRFRLTAATWSFLGAGVAYFVVMLYGQLHAHLGWPAQPWPLSVGVVACTFAAGPLWAELVLRSRRPGLGLAARLTDDRYHLRERTTAALEAARRRHFTRVEEALVEEAEAAAAAIVPAAVVPFRAPRPMIAGILPVTMGIVLALAPSPERSTAGPGQGIAAQAEPQPVPTEQVRRVAELLGRDADRRRDPYLRTLAQSLDRLAADVEHQRVSDTEAREQLQRILSHVAGTLDLADETALREGDGAMGDAASEAPPEGQAATRREGETPPVDDGRGVEPLEAADGTTSDDVTLDGLLERLEMEAVTRATPEERQDLDDARMRAGEQPADDGLYFDNPDLERANELALEAARRRADADAAPDDARAGPGGDGAAGAEEQPIFGSDPDAADVPEAPVEVTLPWQARDPGRRIQVQLAPDAEAGEVEGTLAPEASWLRRPETSVDWQRIDAYDANIVGNYFLPDAAVEGPHAGER